MRALLCPPMVAVRSPSWVLGVGRDHVFQLNTRSSPKAPTNVARALIGAGDAGRGGPRWRPAGRKPRCSICPLPRRAWRRAGLAILFVAGARRGGHGDAAGHRAALGPHRERPRPADRADVGPGAVGTVGAGRRDGVLSHLVAVHPRAQAGAGPGDRTCSTCYVRRAAATADQVRIPGDAARLFRASRMGRAGPRCLASRWWSGWRTGAVHRASPMAISASVSDYNAPVERGLR